MTNIELIAGHVYIVKHTSGMIRARFIAERTIHSIRRMQKRYHFINLATGREIVLKSRVKVRREEVAG